MTEKSDEPSLVDEISQWMLMNYKRETSELLRMLASAWPDATAAELWQAWDRMNSLAEENRQRTNKAEMARKRMRVIEGGSEDEAPEKNGE